MRNSRAKLLAKQKLEQEQELANQSVYVWVERNRSTGALTQRWLLVGQLAPLTDSFDSSGDQAGISHERPVAQSMVYEVIKQIC